MSGPRGVGGGGLPGIGGGSKGPHARPAPSPTKGLNLPRPSPFTNLSSASGRGLGKKMLLILYAPRACLSTDVGKGF